MLFYNVDTCPNEYTKHGCMGLYKWSMQIFQPPSAKFPNRTFSLQYICVDVRYLKYKTVMWFHGNRTRVCWSDDIQLSRSYYKGVLYESAVLSKKEHICHTSCTGNGHVLLSFSLILGLSEWEMPSEVSMNIIEYKVIVELEH